MELRDVRLAETWYRRLCTEIQQGLSTFPFKYPKYHTEPWGTRGVHLFVTRSDVVLYSVDSASDSVYIRGVCTRGRDLAAHLDQTEQS